MQGTCDRIVRGAVCGKPRCYNTGECKSCYLRRWKLAHLEERNAYMAEYRQRPVVRDLANLRASLRYWTDPDHRARTLERKRESASKYRASPEARTRKQAYMREYRAKKREMKHELEQRDRGMADRDVRPTGAGDAGR